MSLSDYFKRPKSIAAPRTLEHLDELVRKQDGLIKRLEQRHMQMLRRVEDLERAEIRLTDENARLKRDVAELTAWVKPERQA